MSPVAQTAISWLLSYALHSTVLLGAAALLARVARDPAWRETLWKAALVGAVLTVSVQTLAGFRPVVGRWPLPGALASATASAPLSPSTSTSPTTDRAAAPAPAAASQSPSPSTAASPATNRAASPAAPAPAAAPRDAGTTTLTSRELVVKTAAAPRPAHWSNTALLVWAAVAALLLARVLWRQAALHRLLSDRRPVDDPALLSLLEALRRRAGVRSAVRLTRSERCATPMALGTREVCVPGRFVDTLAADEQRGALAHELAHLARRDPLWHLAAGLAEALFFFQPLNRLARRRLRETAEYLADDWAVRQTGSPLGLARCLVEVAGWVSAGGGRVPEGALAMAEGNPSSLARRVERLVQRADLPPLPRAGRRVAAALALLAGVALVAPAVAPLAAVPDLSDEAKPPAREARVQEPKVVRHPSPAEPLARRWAWATERGGLRAYWVGWSITPVAHRGNGLIVGTHGLNVSELDGRPLPDLVGASHTDALVLFRVWPGGRLERVSTRVGKLGMDLGGATLYWLGAARPGESLDWLEARERSEGSAEMRAGLLETISLHPEPARVVPLLLERLGNERDEKVRAAAAAGLGRHPRPEALRALVAAAGRDRSEVVRAHAVEGVGEMGSREAAAALREMLRASRWVDVRREAAETLGEQDDPMAAAELERAALRDPDGDVRREAVEALGEQPAARALPVLERLARTHPDPDARREAVETLGDLPALAGLGTLEEIATRGTDPEAQREAVETIGDYPPEVSHPRVRRLATTHPSAEVRRQAVEALGDSKDPDALAALEAIARSDRDVDVQREAVETMGELPAERAVPALVRIAWRHPSLDARREAAETLGEAKTGAALAALDSIVAGHPEEEVQRTAVEAMGEFPSRMSRGRLQRIRETHPNLSIRRAAAETLTDLASQ